MSRLLKSIPKSALRPAARLVRLAPVRAVPLRGQVTLASSSPVPKKPAAAAAASAAAPKGDVAASIIAASAKPKPPVVIAQSLFRSVVLDVPVAKAWAGIRTFAGTWIPDSAIALAPATAADGTNNVIGHARIVTVVPLQKRLVEELVAYDAAAWSYTYRMLAAEDGVFPAPFWHYTGTVRLYPVTEGDKTLATWTVSYETAPGPSAAALATAIGDGTLAANLVAYNQYISGKK